MEQWLKVSPIFGELIQKLDFLIADAVADKVLNGIRKKKKLNTQTDMRKRNLSFKLKENLCN